jgi:hypothetical protein
VVEASKQQVEPHEVLAFDVVRSAAPVLKPKLATSPSGAASLRRRRTASARQHEVPQRASEVSGYGWCVRSHGEPARSLYMAGARGPMAADLTCGGQGRWPSRCGARAQEARQP